MSLSFKQFQRDWWASRKGQHVPISQFTAAWNSYKAANPNEFAGIGGLYRTPRKFGPRRERREPHLSVAKLFRDANQVRDQYILGQTAFLPQKKLASKRITSWERSAERRAYRSERRSQGRKAVGLASRKRVQQMVRESNPLRARVVEQVYGGAAASGY